MASDIPNNCLVCSEVISSNNYVHLDKFDSLFLLRILLEIPQDSQFIYQAQSSLNSLPVCNSCGSTVKQCKETYTEILGQLQKFWGFQNDILSKINNIVDDPHHQSNQDNNWVYLCKQFVKNQKVEAFKYPFVFHDLAKFLNSNSFGISTLPSSSIEVSDTVVAENDKLILKQEPQFEDDNDNCSERDDDNDSSNHNNASSEEDTKRRESKSNQLGVCTDYLCTWPGCGKGLPDKLSYTCHMDRHRGTPKQKCQKCNELFYEKDDLLQHQKKQHENNTENSNISKIPSCSSDSLTNIVKIEEQSSEESSDDYESSDESYFPSSSKKRKTLESKQTDKLNRRESEFSKNYPQYKFVRNPFSEKFHCLEASCPKASVSRTHMETHFQVDHLKIKEKPTFACSWPGCGRTMKCKLNLLAHMDQHKGTPQWKCEQCPTQCYWRSDLAKHMKRKHATELISERAKNSLEQVFIQDPITGKYKCAGANCKKAYKALNFIQNHYKEEHLKVKEKKGFICEYDECNEKKFSYKDHWQGHMDKHRGTPQVKCDQCEKLFYWKGQLNFHVKAHH